MPTESRPSHSFSLSSSEARRGLRLAPGRESFIGGAMNSQVSGAQGVLQCSSTPVSHQGSGCADAGCGVLCALCVDALGFSDCLVCPLPSLPLGAAKRTKIIFVQRLQKENWVPCGE